MKSNKKIIDTKENNNNGNSISVKSMVKQTTTCIASEKLESRIPDWLPEKDNVKIVKPVKKPAHLLSTVI